MSSDDLPVFYTYDRFARHDVPFSCVVLALHRAFEDLDSGEATPVKIADAEQVYYTQDAILEAWNREMDA